MMTTRWFTAAASVVLLSAAVAGVPASASATPSGGGDSATTTGVDKSRALVQLAGDPITTSFKTKPAQGKKIDWAGQNVRSYRAELSARRNEFKRWLRANAPKAKVTGEFDVSLNAVSLELNGTSLDVLRRSPLAVRVEYQGVYSPTVDPIDPDLDIISAVDAWSAGGGQPKDGAGIKVGVVDTGIDVGHSCFDDFGYDDVPEFGDAAFTNNKVIVARVFHNKAKSMQYTAEAIGDHGTHVAGTIACNFQTEATVNDAEIPYGISGVAPHALLGNYNVFPDNVEDARSEDILNALDAAVTDGMDVINMSLGGGSHGIQDLLTVAVDNIDRANIVVAVSAGNEGPGYDTVGSPGMAARALSAGASTVPHFVGATLTVGTDDYAIASGDFEVVTANTTANLAIAEGGTADTDGIGKACTALTAGSLTGNIAVVSRGTCAFTVKVRNAQDAGAVAVIVVNNVAGDPTAMGSDGTPAQPSIPAYMAALDDRPALALSGALSGTISAALAYQSTTSVDIMAGFSSQGPTDVDRRVKPDVVGPGVNVLSSIPRSYCGGADCFAFFSGTSMSSPHLAGSAAVVRQQHSSWTAAQVRSAIVNTADEDALTSYKDGSTLVDDPNIVGAGRENLLSAVTASVLLDPVSVSFGRIPSGSGQSRSATITVTNTTGGALTATIHGDATKFTTTTSIPADATVTIKVTGASAKGQAAGKYWATLRIFNAIGVELAHAVLFYEVG